ncbi:MAG: Mur ligase family protein [Candidatus Pacebacteria bacterium]|nr:Mur ligase family protein [Candidatus Paceibacterota bacterium]
MSNLIYKIIFFWKKPKVLVLTDGEREMIKKSISQVLGSSFRTEREILFLDNAEKINLSNKKYLVLNFDDGNVRRFKEKNPSQVVTFGFKEGADFQATDLKQNGGTNFKVNYQGKIVPIWLQKRAEEKEIYSVLTTVAVSTIFGLNLVEISQALKNYES